MDYLQEFISNELQKKKEREINAEKWRENFLRDYPIETIEKLSVDEYIFSPNKDGVTNNTFCCKLYNNEFISLGN